jgi:urate oxidase
MVHLGPNRYGKAEVRVLRVARGAGPGGSDVIRDWNVSTSLSGDLASSHLTGDNAAVLSTDTQKNTVYAFARRLGPAEPEALALELAAHFVRSQPQISRARVAVTEYGWSRIGATGYSFARGGGPARRTRVVVDETGGRTVVSGLAGLTVLNTTGSEFAGFPRDEYTTLAETTDRILATEVTAWWRYRGGAHRADADWADAGRADAGRADADWADWADADWAAAFGAAQQALLDAFAGTYSYSLQQTLFAMGERVIAEVPAVCEVRLALPNKHHYLVDLAPFGLANEREVYYPGDRPYGLIEGTVLADDAPEPGAAWD